LYFAADGQCCGVFNKPKTAFGFLALPLILLAVQGSSAGQVAYPVPGLVDESTGFLESKIGGSWYRGSGVVAQDPRLIFSCAHVLYENGRWATDYVFHRAYHGRRYPRIRDGVLPRGFRHFSSYAPVVRNYGSDTDLAFALDFTVLYGNSDFGPAAECWKDGASALRSGRPKMLVGYPAEVDFNRSRGFSYQHSTPWFRTRAYTVKGAFHEFRNVSTGPGNSGGPIYVRHNAKGRNLVAGILVSGSRRTAGVAALSPATRSLATAALGSTPRSQEFRSTERIPLRDGDRWFSSSPIEVTGLTGGIASLRFSMVTEAERPEDLEVYLKSPAGRIHWISRGRGGSVQEVDLSRSFQGGDPNGTWQLMMRDAVSGNASTFMKASIQIGTL
jgi:hypothetical protein